MLTLISVEFLKLRRCKIWWLILSIFAAHAYSDILKVSSYHWDVFLNATYMNLWLRPILFTFLSGYLFTRDDEQRMQVIFFSYPFNRSLWFLSKCLTAFLWVGMILFVSGIIDVSLGMLFLQDPYTLSVLKYQCMSFLGSWILFSGLIPLGIILALGVRSTVRLGILSVLIPLLELPLTALFPKYALINPWLLPYLYFSFPYNYPTHFLWERGLWISVTLIAASLFFSWYLYVARDPKTDSYRYSLEE
ncbi:ABC transporter permease [Paenibacillus azoreducens]|uniref:ABC transporter permease n=1 Tax=Paenibacillus azoreducens TaxID=116718 RepID=UPI0039F620EF